MGQRWCRKRIRRCRNGSELQPLSFSRWCMAETRRRKYVIIHLKDSQLSPSCAFQNKPRARPAQMDRERRSELAFRPLTDSRAQRAPASTQLAFSGRWTEGMVREAGSISSSSTKPGFFPLPQPFFFHLPPVPIFHFHHTVTKPLSAVTRNGKTAGVIYKIHGRSGTPSAA